MCGGELRGVSPCLLQQVSHCFRAHWSPHTSCQWFQGQFWRCRTPGSITASLAESDLEGLALSFSPPTSWGLSSGLIQVSNCFPWARSFADRKCVWAHSTTKVLGLSLGLHKLLTLVQGPLKLIPSHQDKKEKHTRTDVAEPFSGSKVASTNTLLTLRHYVE